MNHSDVSLLLSKAALIDSRTIDRATVEAWWEAIGHQSREDAFDALYLHRATSTEWLEPAHINALVPVVRRNRERVQSAARALTAGPLPPIQGPPPGFRESAGMKPREDHPPIPCPWCGAKAHSPCTTRGTRKERRLAGTHEARLEALAAAGASSVSETEEESW